MSRVIEIRSYTLKPGTRDTFDRLFQHEAAPMLARWKIDVVRAGPSLHDDNAYFLMRAFDSIADRDRREAEFYGSDEWRHGPREDILACIEAYTETVFEASDAAVEMLRFV